jgi:peptidoglycan/xylan/chitin deacetylase (PgdA/CDA1 family)
MQMFPYFSFHLNKAYSVLLAVVLFSTVCLAQSTNNIRIAKFKADKTCAISYTFDDGLKEHYTLVTPWFNQLGLKGTFVVNGSKINRDEKTITDTTRMTWQNLKEMAGSGQEISNHGWEHKNFGRYTLEEIKEDIYKNDSAIMSNIGIMPRTFAYPNNTKTTEGVKIASENRVGTRTFQRSVGGKSTRDNLESWVNDLLDKQDWGVAMTHGITYGYDHFTSPNILWDHLQYVKGLEDKIWVGTFREVAAYTRERDSTKLGITKAGKGHYIVTPGCRLNKTIFTEQLTAVLEESRITKVAVRQGKNKLNAQVFPGKIIFNFDPFGEAIDIRINTK